MSEREKLILEIAEKIADTDTYGYWYPRDFAKAYRLGDTELEIAYELSKEFKR